jgi:phage I-like protein
MMRKQFIYSGTKRIALEVSGAPNRVPLHPFGTFTGNGSSYTFDDRSLESVRAQLLDQGVPWPLDYHHASIKVEQNQADRAPRAASITDVEVENGWVYGIIEDWTTTAAQEVANGDFIFVSSVLYYLTDEGPDQGLVVGYHSHALTNKPGTKDQRRIGLEQSDGGTRMNEWLLKLLGLPADATEDQARTALEAVLARGLFADQVMVALEITSPALTPEVRGRIMKLAALEGMADDLGRATATLEQQAKTNNTVQIDAALKVALEAGRIFDPEAPMWRTRLEGDFEAGRVALESMPVRVPTAANAVKVIDSKTGQVALEEGQVKINNLLGVNAEDFAKYAGGDQK